GGRSDVLWSEYFRAVPPRWRLRRQDSARGEAGQFACRAADQVRSRYQPDYRQSAGPDDSADAARPRRRGDRVKRREFITLLGGALAAQAIPANAQELRVRTVGVLMGFANDAEAKARVQVFEQGLEREGWSAKTFASSTAMPKATPRACRRSRKSWWN